MVKEREDFTPDKIAQIESSAVLSDAGIVYQRLQGKIVIEPFSWERLSTSSYDLTLGENYFIRAEFGPGKLNLCDASTAEKIWSKPKKAVLAKEYKEKHDQFLPSDFWEGIKDDDKLIIVPPSGVLLVHSHEFAGTRDGYTSEVRCTTTLERLGITVPMSAGSGDVGFFGRWTFLLKNAHESSEVLLKVGITFAQTTFKKCQPTEISYVRRGGKYQETEDLEELKASWDENPGKYMLPKVPKC
ncbi:hypothetical protein A2Z23_03480 [Candidatus Curtissbacteria bacterium RBG_16_39_7]|uniref:Deoxycytidine triphosphate deaminase n=1 Tax=Candidatus Curtissbacteria bacterium RBG_16_39_7 TaxID=1797707 RepID=A0A1F5G4T8_9BACT|nr:MAG: hypothetical protein A2Z23_03480 [Candidatus Curtissbacteria bacterium RBG_16_39_7]